MPEERISTGVHGLDEILEGGLLTQKSYLLRGGPGSGKSTFGYKFLEEGVRAGETSLLISLGESRESVASNTAGLGINFEKVEVLDLSPKDSLYKDDASYTVFPSSDVETSPLVEQLVEVVDRVKPDRVLLDSVTMLKYLNSDPYQYRNLVLSFIRYICSRGATLLIVSESSSNYNEEEATYWVDGIINLTYSPDWRRINVVKLRGSGFQTGNHAFTITDSGVSVFPKLRSNNYEHSYANKTLSTGLDELDDMLHGGIEKGTITMLTGPTGAGKTNLGLQVMKEAASRDERSVVYSFEESADVLIRRTAKIGIPVEEMIRNGNLKVKTVEPFSYSPDEFSSMVRSDIEENDTRIVMIDTVGSYALSVRDENYLERLHALCLYMQNMGVTGLLVNETKSVASAFVTTNLNASYLADNIIFLRYYELKGTLRKAIGILKKRLSDFDNSIREYKISTDGIEVGRALTNMRGIMSGLAENIGE